MRLHIFFFLNLIFFHVNISNAKRVPVIAILANPDPCDSEIPTSSIVNAFYVHWLEQSLADVVVIHPWHTEEEIEEIISKVNGVLFPGGDRNLNLNQQFEKVSRIIFQKIITKCDNEGITIPLWGTCQGLQLFHALVADTLDVLTKFDAWEITSPVILNNNEMPKNKMFEDFDSKDLYNIQKMNTTAQFHHLGVSETQYEKYPKLKDFFRITSYGLDNNGKQYIASVEGKRYPIYAVQFHPEMVSYTKIPSNGVPRNMEAIRISQILGNFFIKQALLNENFMSYEEMKRFDYIDSFKKLPISGNKDGSYYYHFSKKKLNLK